MPCTAVVTNPPQAQPSQHGSEQSPTAVTQRLALPILNGDIEKKYMAEKNMPCKFVTVRDCADNDGDTDELSGLDPSNACDRPPDSVRHSDGVGSASNGIDTFQGQRNETSLVTNLNLVSSAYNTSDSDSDPG